jgi:hypothetical protein
MIAHPRWVAVAGEHGLLGGHDRTRLRDEREALGQRHPTCLDGREFERPLHRELRVAHDRLGDGESRDQLLLVVGGLHAHPDDLRNERLQVRVVVSERARLRRAALRSRDLRPTLG